MGFSTLWFGPAVNPSREIDWWQVTLLICQVRLISFTKLIGQLSWLNYRLQEDTKGTAGGFRVGKRYFGNIAGSIYWTIPT